MTARSSKVYSIEFTCAHEKCADNSSCSSVTNHNKRREPRTREPCLGNPLSQEVIAAGKWRVLHLKNRNKGRSPVSRHWQLPSLILAASTSKTRDKFRGHHEPQSVPCGVAEDPWMLPVFSYWTSPRWIPPASERFMPAGLIKSHCLSPPGLCPSRRLAGHSIQLMSLPIQWFDCSKEHLHEDFIYSKMVHFYWHKHPTARSLHKFILRYLEVIIGPTWYRHLPIPSNVAAWLCSCKQEQSIVLDSLDVSSLLKKTGGQIKLEHWTTDISPHSDDHRHEIIAISSCQTPLNHPRNGVHASCWLSKWGAFWAEIWSSRVAGPSSMVWSIAEHRPSNAICQVHLTWACSYIFLTHEGIKLAFHEGGDVADLAGCLVPSFLQRRLGMRTNPR